MSVNGALSVSEEIILKLTTSKILFLITLDGLFSKILVISDSRRWNDKQTIQCVWVFEPMMIREKSSQRSSLENLKQKH